MIDRTQPDWRHTWLLGIAEAVGAAADCTRRRVGAVIFDPTTWHILATGYNGLAAGLPGCATAGACPRGQLTYEQMPTGIGGGSSYLPGQAGACQAVHAEDNALRRARDFGINVAGAWVAITAEPCEVCYGLLRHYGIAGAIWPDGMRVLVDHPNGAAEVAGSTPAGV